LCEETYNREVHEAPWRLSMFDRLDEEQNKIQQREIEDFSRKNYNQPLAVIHQYNSSDDLSEFQPLTKPAKKRQQQVYNFGFVV